MHDLENIKIIIDSDRKLYEIHSFIRKTIDIFLVPILNRLPRGLFRKSSKKAETVNKHATTHRALEVIYSFNNQVNFEKGIFDGFFTYFWQKTSHAKALRNRLKLVKRELLKAIHSLNKKEIKILNLACGSNRAVIEVVGMHKNDFDFKVFGMDKNESAIEDAKALTTAFDVDHLFSWHQNTVSGFLKEAEQAQFDIVEMVGFLDYVPDEKAVFLFDQIYSVLADGGFFITGNIKDNKERRFVTEVVGWPHLIFRSENDLARILKQSKFKDAATHIVYEPHNIHGVVVCKK
ncbi:class I SAM-dependent methyltransferase [Candidatus Azambacteria bacterium]|nr:class I SAM-dependent methyltransferase [Candidatus Azambacteria bacterium]